MRLITALVNITAMIADVVEDGDKIKITYTADVNNEGSITRLGFADVIYRRADGVLVHEADVSRYGFNIGTVSLTIKPAPAAPVVAALAKATKPVPTGKATPVATNAPVAALKKPRSRAGTDQAQLSAKQPPSHPNVRTSSMAPFIQRADERP